jgi:hypothetical protein
MQYSNNHVDIKEYLYTNGLSLQSTPRLLFRILHNKALFTNTAKQEKLMMRKKSVVEFRV